MPVKVTINRNWSRDIEENLDKKGLLSMVTDIHNRSKVLAPVDTRALVNSARIDRRSDGYAITYGSGAVPYARRRYYENKKNPQTKRWLERAADGVMRGDKGKHFRGVV